MGQCSCTALVTPYVIPIPMQRVALLLLSSPSMISSFTWFAYMPLIGIWLETTSSILSQSMSILDLPLSSAETSMLFLTGLRIIMALLLLSFLAILLGLFSLFSESAVWWTFGATYNPTTPLSRIDLVGCPLPWLHHVRLVISSLVHIVTMRLSSWYAPFR